MCTRGRFQAFAASKSEDDINCTNSHFIVIFLKICRKRHIVNV